MSAISEFWNLSKLFAAFPDEQTCVALFRRVRWPEGTCCPYCGHHKIYRSENQRQQQCAHCKRSFSIKVGTIFQNSPLPIRKWFAAIWLLANSQNGVTTIELASAVGVPQGTAWLMLRRLRYATMTATFRSAPDVRGIPHRRRTRNPIKSIYAEKLRINIPFDEALTRFIAVGRPELQQMMAKELPKRKSRKPPQARSLFRAIESTSIDGDADVTTEVELMRHEFAQQSGDHNN